MLEYSSNNHNHHNHNHHDNYDDDDAAQLSPSQTTRMTDNHHHHHHNYHEQQGRIPTATMRNQEEDPNDGDFTCTTITAITTTATTTTTRATTTTTTTTTTTKLEQFQSLYDNHCIYLLPMLGWFLFSGLLSLYNKYIFGDTHMAFPCPLLMTSVHFASQFLFSYFLTKMFPIALGGDQVEAMSWSTFLSVAIPCGLVTSLDVGLSNLALVRITMTFYTMVKSSSPIFVVASAYFFGIERITPALILTVFIISAGELLTVMGEVAFDLIGFVLVLSASILSGMRWTVVQLKLQSLEPRLKSTIAVMRILSPFMFLSMLFLSFVLETPWTRFGNKVTATGSDNKENDGISFFDTPRDVLWTLGLGLIGATLAICMIICEFYLIMKSSAVVLMIGGVLKELTTIMIGVTIMGDQLNTVNSLGCVVVFSGVLLYKISHHLEQHQKVYDSVDMVDSHGGSTVPFVVEESRSMMEDAAGGESRMPRESYDLEHEGVAGLKDGSDVDVYGTINKRRKGTRTTIVDHESNPCRPLVQVSDSELI